MQTARDKSHNKNYYIENLLFGKKSESSCAEKCDEKELNKSESSGENYRNGEFAQNA
jgi:hypothetical protein